MIPQLEAVAAEVEIWARHFTSSVGVDTTQVARPPIAPAIQVVQRDGGEVAPRGFWDLRREEVRL